MTQFSCRFSQKRFNFSVGSSTLSQFFFFHEHLKYVSTNYPKVEFTIGQGREKQLGASNAFVELPHSHLSPGQTRETAELWSHHLCWWPTLPWLQFPYGVCSKPHSCQKVLTTLTDGHWQWWHLKEALSSLLIFRDSFPSPSTTLTLEFYAHPSVMESPPKKQTIRNVNPRPWKQSRTSMNVTFLQALKYKNLRFVSFSLFWLTPPSSFPSSPPRNPLDYSLTQHWNPWGHCST